jgi:transposase
VLPFVRLLYFTVQSNLAADKPPRARGKYKVSRRTVRAALQSAWPQPRKPMPPRASKLDALKPIIDDILRADLDAPRKQRHTVTRIYDRLVAEHAFGGNIIETGTDSYRLAQTRARTEKQAAAHA